MEKVRHPKNADLGIIEVCYILGWHVNRMFVSFFLTLRQVPMEGVAVGRDESWIEVNEFGRQVWEQVCCVSMLKHTLSQYTDHHKNTTLPSTS
jgi:hypothetical protein